MSKSSDSKRKTLFTVEAVSLDRPEDTDKSWIGINQNAANRYVEHFLTNGGFKNKKRTMLRWTGRSIVRPLLNYYITSFKISRGS